MLSFIFQNKDLNNKIKSVYLFGSAVRGSLAEKSDIDLFFDCDEEDEKQLKQLIDSGIVKFEYSKDYEKWKLFHFTYPFSVQIGNIEEWDLKLSIASEGILLYSSKPFISVGKRYVLFIIKYPKKKKDYIRIKRLLFGRDEEFYKGRGLIQSIKGKKLSSNVFSVPKEEQAKIMDLLSEKHVDFFMAEIVSLE